MPDTICFIYNYLTLKRKIQAYYIVGFFSEGGELKRDRLHKSYEEMFHSTSDNEYIGPFQSLDDIRKYCFALCDYLNAQNSQILSVEEYNVMIENVTNRSEFAKQILLFGDSLLNPSHKKRKHFFQDFFH